MNDSRMRLWPVVSVPTGRFGHRRARLGECYGGVLVEDLYSGLLRGDVSLAIGERREFRVRLAERSFWVEVELISNPIWRAGRLFLRCSEGCGRRCTRLYWAIRSFPPLLCRMCLGLTYASRNRNYKSQGIRWLPYTHRERAYLDAALARERRLELRRARQQLRQWFVVNGQRSFPLKNRFWAALVHGRP